MPPRSTAPGTRASCCRFSSRCPSRRWATLAIFAFIGNWNNFFGPLLYLRTPDVQTLPVCLVQYQGAYGNTEWHLMMAVATIAVIPVLLIFIFGQRYFVEGIATSGVKR